MNVGQIHSRTLITVPASAPLSQAAQLMHDHHIGAVVVVKAPLDQPVAVGVITDRDIVRAQLERTSDLTRIRAEDVMTREPLVLEEAEPLDSAINKLRTRGVRRAPVVDAHGRLRGLISTDDVITHLATELGSIARVLELQPKREGDRASASAAH